MFSSLIGQTEVKRANETRCSEWLCKFTNKSKIGEKFNWAGIFKSKFYVYFLVVLLKICDEMYRRYGWIVLLFNIYTSGGNWQRNLSEVRSILSL